MYIKALPPLQQLDGVWVEHCGAGRQGASSFLLLLKKQRVKKEQSPLSVPLKGVNSLKAPVGRLLPRRVRSMEETGRTLVDEVFERCGAVLDGTASRKPSSELGKTNTVEAALRAATMPHLDRDGVLGRAFEPCPMSSV